MTRSRKQDHDGTRTQAAAAEGSVEEPVPTDAPGSSAGPSPGSDADPGAAPAPPPAADEPTPEQTLRRERDDFQEKWLRALAELDNVRKRSRREVQDARRLAQAELLRGFLDVHDNFSRALQSLRDSQDQGGAEGIRQGVELIFQKLQAVLKDSGAVPIAALGREFDPAFHDAVAQIPREGAAPGLVIEVVQEGFMLGEMVLRPARVILSS